MKLNYGFLFTSLILLPAFLLSSVHHWASLFSPLGLSLSIAEWGDETLFSATSFSLDIHWQAWSIERNTGQ